MESKHHSDTYLNLLMMPAIFFSAMASVFGSVSKHYKLEWGTIALSFVNAGIAFLLAVINYFVDYMALKVNNTDNWCYKLMSEHAGYRLDLYLKNLQ